MRSPSRFLFAVVAALVVLIPVAALGQVCPPGFKHCGANGCAPQGATCCPGGGFCLGGTCYGRFCIIGEPSDQARCEVENGQGAIASCTRAIASRQFKDDDLVELYKRRASLLLGDRKYDGAIADFAQIIRLSANDESARAQALVSRAEAYEAKSDHDRAIADYTEALRLRPASMELAARGDVYLKKGEYDRAIADYTEAIKLESFDASHIYLRRAAAYRRKGDRDRAIRDYDEARFSAEVDEATKQEAEKAVEELSGATPR